ncbi:MAG: N-6 DNA methylase [Cyanobacteria bacterium P01_H01_bin.58]
MTDELRLSGLSPEDAVVLSLQMLSWVKLSALEVLPDELRLSEEEVSHPQLIFDQLAALADASSYIDQNSKAFQGSISWHDAMNESRIAAALVQAVDAQKYGVLDNFHLPVEFSKSMGLDGFILVPDEMANLMIGLLGDVGDKSVYCLHDSLALFSGRLLQDAQRIGTETLSITQIPYLINILNNLNAEHDVFFGDFITNPSFVIGKLPSKFDLAISVPPIGKVGVFKDVIKKDALSRFPEVTLSWSVLSIRQLIFQAKLRAVIAVPSSMLSGRGADYELRQSLVNKGYLEAVIKMPPAILPGVAIPMSILILDFQKQLRSIRFIDGGANEFVTKDGWNRLHLSGWQELLNFISTGNDSSIVRNVPVEKIKENEFYLEVSRYLLTPEVRKVNKILEQYSKQEIENCAEIIRPLAWRNKEGKIKVFEAVTSDFPAYGFLSRPQKNIGIDQSIPEDVARKKRKKPSGIDQFLKPYDILVSIKGNTGMVAIVPPEVPLPGENGWVVSPSCLILRVNQEIIDPIVLFMYLRSDMGQILLNRIVSSSATAHIHPASLKSLPVVIPDSDEALDIAELFSNQVELQARIEQLKQEQYELGKAYWGINSES